MRSTRPPAVAPGRDPAVAADAIVVEDLRVIRGGRQVVGPLSMAVPRGTVTGLLGPSGCGKTTLMRAVVGVQILAGGRVEALGLPAGAPALRARVGYVTQAPSVYGDLTVMENLRYFAAIAGAGRDRVGWVLATVGLSEHRTQMTASLSGGERARLSLATALLARPEVLVLDEPTVGLDPVLRDDLWTTFRDLAHEGTTFLVSSHVMDEAAECDRLVLMRDGVLLDETTPEAMRRRTGEQDLARAFMVLIGADPA